MVRSTEASPPASPPERRFPVRLVLLGVVAVVSVAFGFLTQSVNDARIWVQHFGYYTIAGTFAWTVLAVLRAGPDWIRSWPQLSRRELVVLAGVIGGLTAVAVMTVPYTYKVLYDEYVLQATAWCMHQMREVGTIVRGYTIEGVFTPLLTYLDKRPVFYPFVLSLLHDLTGFREANAFVFNTALLPVALGLFYLLMRRLAGHLASLAALLAFGAFSLLAQNATSAGMEMLNLVMLLLVMNFAVHYLARPDERRLTILILTAVLLAQTRYESSLYVGPVALIILEGWRRRGQLILPAAAMLAPALLIPYALQNTYLSGTPMLWELRQGESARFGLEYLAGNLQHAGHFFFSFSGVLTNSWWLALAGFPALIWAIVAASRGLRRWRCAPAPAVTTVLFGGAILLNLGLLMFYYWGQLDDPIVSRLSLPFSVLLALCLGWALSQLPDRLVPRASRIAMLGAGFCYLTSGLVGNATFWALNTPGREIAWEFHTVQQMPPAPRLIITDKSALIWLINKIPAIQVLGARNRAEQIEYHLEQHTFSDVLVMQTYLPIGPDGGFRLDPEDRLPDSFELEPLIERRFGTHIARISRVKAIHLPVVASSPPRPGAPKS